MALEIIEVATKSDLKQFVKLPFILNRDNPFWVPPLISEEMKVFNPDENPAFETAEARLFLARKNGRVVGRVAAILSLAANELYDQKNLRFGWLDFIDDFQVAAALLDRVESWARELGLETITGPQGFNNLDPVGMLIEGFDQPSIVAAIYNQPYYPEFAARYGLAKKVDYVEMRTEVPYEQGMPPVMRRMTERIERANGLKVLEWKSKKDLNARSEEIFAFLNQAYTEIYGFVPLTIRQINYYRDKYLPLLKPELCPAVVDENGDLAAFLIVMPNLSQAFRKANGRLFPLGWWHLTRALKKYQAIDFLLIGVRDDLRKKGVPALMLMKLSETIWREGVSYCETSPMLEHNSMVQALHKYFPTRINKRRRVFQKKVEPV